MISIIYNSYSTGRNKKNTENKTIQKVKLNPKGLSDAEATLMMQKYGKNVLTKKKSKSFLEHFISNFNDPIIKILLGALLLNILFSFRHSNWPETIGVAIAILIATVVSTVSEYSSCRAAEKLSEEDNGKCSVRRNGKLTEICITEIAVGDIVLLGSGMMIPADGALISGEIHCNQSALTGEGKEIKKRSINNISLAENFVGTQTKIDSTNQNYVFKGSTVVSGGGEFIVLRTGDSTMYGEVAAGLHEESPESPLKKKLSVLASEISLIGYIAAGLVAISYLFNVFVIDSGMDMSLALLKLKDIPYLFHELLSALTLAVSILVVAVPEGLPMMITVVLSSNMKKMLRYGVLVKKMVGIETAGSMSILFTDKTGTLTEGKMALKSVLTAEECYYSLSSIKMNRALYRALYTTSCIIPQQFGQNSADDAIAKFFNIEEYSSFSTCRIPFSSENRFAAALSSSDKNITYVRGAPEIILKASSSYLDNMGNEVPITEETLNKIKQKWYNSAKSGCRIIASAYVRGNKLSDISSGKMPELVLCGLICLEDRLRHDAEKSVKEAQNAGIKVVMMTGDNKMTAECIARQCGIMHDGDIILTGEELSEIDDNVLREMLPKISVIARALPTDKLRIIKVARSAGYISGMTGDGINDAPSLKAADVGFAMGNGTDVTKEAGDIVITNNSFTTIVNAVLYGRTIFRSIRKFIVFQLTMNLCATAISFIGPFIGIESPVTIIQMLWVNIIMDTLGALAFAGEPPRKKYMELPPYKTDVKILTGEMIGGILLNGSFMIALSVFFLTSDYCKKLFGGFGDVYFLTTFFAFFIFLGIFMSFNSRTPKLFFLSEIKSNKPFIIIMLLVATVQLTLIYFGGEVFRCTPLLFSDILKTAALSAMILPAGTIFKIFMKNRNRDL